MVKHQTASGTSIHRVFFLAIELNHLKQKAGNQNRTFHPAHCPRPAAECLASSATTLIKATVRFHKQTFGHIQRTVSTGIAAVPLRHPQRFSQAELFPPSAAVGGKPPTFQHLNKTGNQNETMLRQCLVRSIIIIMYAHLLTKIRSFSEKTNVYKPYTRCVPQVHIEFNKIAQEH